MILLRLYTRGECHLCEAMQEVVNRASQSLAVRLEVVDVDLDAELIAHYGEEVPVLFVNGRKFAKYRVDEELLRSRLVREAGKPAGPINERIE